MTERIFTDELDWELFRTTGVAMLQRFYDDFSVNGFAPQYIPELAGGWHTPIPIVAKGAAAYLCYWPVSVEAKYPSVRLLAYQKNPIKHEQVFERYYSACMSALVAENEKKVCPSARKSKQELVTIHLNRENEFLEESEYLFQEVRNFEAKTMVEIRDLAKYYRAWVTEKYSNESVNEEREESPSPDKSESAKNPLSRIFTSERGYLIFNKLLEGVPLRQQLAYCSYYYRVMVEDKLIHEACGPGEFRRFLSKYYQIELDEIKSKYLCEGGSKSQIYATIKTSIQ